MVVLCDFFWESLANAAIADALAGPFSGPLAGGSVLLFTQASRTDASTQLSDLTEASFTGYARKPLSWAGVVPAADGTVGFASNTVYWAMTGTTAGETVLGWALIDAAGTDLVAIELFGSGVAMLGPPDAIALSLYLQLGGQSNNGHSCVAPASAQAA